MSALASPRATLVLTLWATAVALAYLIWGWSDDLSELGGDSAGYVLAAQYYSPFVAPSPVLTEYSHHIIYPPLFPFLVGLTGGSVLAGHLTVIASLAGALACLFGWLRAEGMDTPRAAVAVLLFASMPGTYLQALSIWTENTFLFFSLLALFAYSTRPQRGGAIWFAATAVACATLCRVAALPLLVAFAAVLFLERRWRALGPMAVAALPILLWTAWSRHSQTGVGAYTRHWIDEYQVADFFGLLMRDALALPDAWCQTILGASTSPALHAVTLLLGAVCVAGWLRRLAQIRLDAIYVAVYAAMLIAWPHPEEAERYLYPVVPVFLAQGLLLVRETAAHWPRLRAAPGCLLGAQALLLLPALLLTFERWQQPLPRELAGARHLTFYYDDNRTQALLEARTILSLFDGLRHAAERVSRQDCIFFVKPTIATLYAERESRVPPPATATGEAFERQIGECRYGYAMGRGTHSYPAMYPYFQLGSRARVLSADMPFPDRPNEATSLLFEILPAETAAP